MERPCVSLWLWLLIIWPRKIIHFLMSGSHGKLYWLDDIEYIATSLSESLFIEDGDEEEGNSNIGGGMAEKNKIQ